MNCALVYGPYEGGAALPMGALTLAAVSARNGFEEPDVVALPPRGEEARFVEAVGCYDLVGFTSVCSTYPRILLLCQALRRNNPSILIVLGGPQATSTARETLRRFACVDLVIRGEAEEGWRVLMEELHSGRRDWGLIPGCTWRRGEDVVENALPPLMENLDELPVPLFSAFGDLRSMQVCMVEVGRGCPYACTFCSTNTFFKRRFRMKSPSRIVQEVDAVHREFGIRHFDFVHDMFTVRRDTVLAICDAMHERAYTWNCSCRTDRVDLPLLVKMKSSGCTGLYVGLETGSQRLQKETKKGLDVTQAVATIRLALSLGFTVTTSVIVGYPNETKQDLYNTLLLVSELSTGLEQAPRGGSLVLQVHLFAPLADTPMTVAGGRFLFDGNVSNTVELDGRLDANEANLILSSFDLFSAFYYPADTAYSRSDYLALTALLDALAQHRHLRHQLLQVDRWEFLDFLLRGQFRVDPGTMSKEQMGKQLLAEYASCSRNMMAPRSHRPMVYVQGL